MSHWLADRDPDRADTSTPWQPCLETEEGYIPCFDIWFASRQECEDWIRRYAVGAGLK